MAALAEDFLALLRQRQAVDLHHVVEHASEYTHHFAEALPVETRLFGEGLDDEAGQVDRAEQAGAVRGEWLLTALPGHQAIEDHCVVIRLGGIEHRFLAEVFDMCDPRREALGLAQHLAVAPGEIAFGLGRQQEPYLRHEAIAGFAVDDELEVFGASIFTHAAPAIRHHPQAFRTALANAAEHTEVGQQPLYIPKQLELTGGQAHGTALLALRDIQRAVALEQRAQVALHTIFASAPDDFGHPQLGCGAEPIVLQHPCEQDRADEDHVALRNRYRRHLAGVRGASLGNQRVDVAGDAIG
ncbi:hypothetical protein D3C78_658960 [compost metagenome]